MDESIGPIQHLSSIIAGEGGITCGYMAALAIAYIYQKNKVWYGHGQTNYVSDYYAEFWWQYPDPTNGARYLFSDTDLQNPRVQRIIKNKSPSLVIDCKNGLHLNAYQ